MKVIKKFSSKDPRVFKFVQQTKDNKNIETGLYLFEENVLCISCQTACPMNCIFCASSVKSQKTKSFRNLTSKEILDQIDNTLSELPKDRIDYNNLFSFMGMGEPFLNYENIVSTIQVLMEKYPNSRVTISTLGIRPDLIEKLANTKFKIPVKLHLSLHGPNNKLRKQILPSSSDINLALKALKFYSEKTKTTPKVNYTLIKDVNDSEKSALELAQLLKPYQFIAMISRLNRNNDLLPASPEKFSLFMKILTENGIKCEYCVSEGDDIAAACGQFGKVIKPAKIRASKGK